LGLPPPFVVGIEAVVLDAAARLGHHLRHRVAPGLVVGCLFVVGGVVGRAIDLDQRSFMQ
jgi:hypothetical protein